MLNSCALIRAAIAGLTEVAFSAAVLVQISRHQLLNRSMAMASAASANAAAWVAGLAKPSSF